MNGTHNELSAAASHVVQARDIHGGVHLRPPRRPGLPKPRLLPPDVTLFTGRDTELTQLDALLNTATPTAMVIAGTAGMGKTSLAVHWAHRVRDQFPDGQLYVNLHGFDPGPPTNPHQALDGLLRALHVPGESIPTHLEAMTGHYRSLLADRRMLIVLDNAATPDQVRPLLPASPTCLVLVTSRSRLSGLVARDGARRITLDLLSPIEAVTLLRDIVGTPRADAEPEALRELARRCAYLPLAVRIAAERVTAHPHLPIADLVTDLSLVRDRLSVLASGDDETTAVRTVLSWSYRALTPETARLFRMLGLHPGPDISVPAAAALTATTPTEVRRLLDVLAAVHLLEETGPDRYAFHDLLRAYAAERATTDSTEPERTAAIGRVLEWYLHTAAAAFHVLNPGQFNRPIDIPSSDCRPSTFASRDHALRWYDLERANLMAATGHAADIGRYDIAWKLPVAMNVYCHLRSRWAEHFAAHQIGLAAAQHIHDQLAEYWVLVDLSDTYVELERFDDTVAHAVRALTIARKLSYRWGEGYALQMLGYSLCGLRRFDQAIDHLGQALILGREIDDQWCQARALVMIGEARRGKHQLDEALSYTYQGLEIIRTIHRPWEEAYALRTLARIYLGLGRPDDAINFFQQSVTCLHKLDHHYRAAKTLQELGEAQYGASRLPDARESWRAALAIYDDLNSPQAAKLRARLDG